MAKIVPYSRRHNDATYSSAPASVARIRHSMEDRRLCQLPKVLLYSYKGVGALERRLHKLSAGNRRRGGAVAEGCS